MDTPHDNRDFIHLGPYNTSVLRSQQSHRCEVVWNEPQDVSVITCRRYVGVLHSHIIDDRLIPYFRASGFYGAIQLGFFQLDYHLIIALVRWRSETHIFMLSHGEYISTLQDMGLISRLHIDSTAIIGTI